MTDIEWNLHPIAIRLLKENPKNPRQIDKKVVEKLGTFIEKFGLIDKPIINQDNTIIGGHQRIRILKKNKVKTVECWVPNRMLNEKEIDEMCVGLNLHQGQWNWDVLANAWDPLDLLSYGFTEEQLLGVSKEDIAEELPDGDEEKKKKKNKCPSCGHEF
jgi:ParB-like chromosome segregation protein Spo0J